MAVRRQAAAGPDVSCIAGDTSHNVTMRDGHHSTVGFASFYDQTRMSQHTASHAGVHIVIVVKYEMSVLAICSSLCLLP